MSLPTEPKRRKKIPLATGCLDYFPLALCAVAEVSRVGNDQHNPGQPLHWDRSKSMDQDDTALRHFLERGKFDTDGARHRAKVAWRVLAALQLEIEEDGGAITRDDLAECVEKVELPESCQCGEPPEWHLHSEGPPVEAGEPFFTEGKPEHYGRAPLVDALAGAHAEAQRMWNKLHEPGPTVEETIAETPTCNICGEKKWTPEGHVCASSHLLNRANLDVV